MSSDLELGYGLKLRAHSRTVWLIFPEHSPTKNAAVCLTFTAQNSPSFREALCAFLAEHMPEGSADVRGYLERLAKTQARLTSPTWGKPAPPSAGG